VISVQNLTKKFDGNVLFTDFSMIIKKGEMVALCGQSGCGKTTLLNIIGLLDSDYTGKVVIDNNHVVSYKSDNISSIIRSKIAYLFQNYALIDDKDIYYNLNLAFFNKESKSIKEAKMKEALNLVGLTKSFNTEVYKLSGGEQQRLSIARAILLDRDIYLCDEPTGNLDIHNREIVMKLLESIHAKGKTVIIVTHDPYVASKCSRVIDLSQVI
jgi:putative ABC transport system ATP-binding protein